MIDVNFLSFRITQSKNTPCSTQFWLKSTFTKKNQSSSSLSVVIGNRLKYTRIHQTTCQNISITDRPQIKICTKKFVSVCTAPCSRTGGLAALLSTWPHRTGRPTSWRTRRPTGTSCRRERPLTCVRLSFSCPRNVGDADTTSSLPSNTTSCVRNVRHHRPRRP